MRHTWLLIVLLLGGALGAGAQSHWPLALRKSFEDGVKAQKAGKLDDAEKIFLGLLAGGGEASFVYHNLGIVYQQKGEHDLAIEQFRKALEIEPTFARSRALLGASLLATGKTEEALVELKKAEKALPKEPIVHLSLAKAYGRMGKLEEQVVELRRLRKLAPKEPEYAYLLGRAYTRLSAAYYAKIPQVSPECARFYQTAGENYFLQKQDIRAIQAFRNAVKADPKLPGVHLMLARVYQRQHKIAEARKEVEMELSIMPGSVMALRLQQQLAPGQVNSRP